jgi:hypothetical protein
MSVPVDQNKISEALNLPPGESIYLEGLQLVVWGQDMIFNGHYGDTPFTLTLTDCRELRWQLYSHMRPDERMPFPCAALVNLSLGKDQHRQPLHMLTDYFGLSVSYGQCVIAPLR